MIKREYHCLVSGLPDLLFSENKSGIKSIAFKPELKNQLYESDYQLVQLLFYPYDNENLLNIYFKQDILFNTLGNITETNLEEQLLPDCEPVLPAYMLQFIADMSKQETKEKSFEAENLLYGLYYDYALSIDNYFLRKWFLFELNLKNCLTAFNSKRFGYELSRQLIKTEAGYEFYELLLNKGLKDMQLIEDHLPHANRIFKLLDSEIEVQERERSLDKIRWDYVDELTIFHYFTIEKVLSYLVKLLIAERWLILNKESGMELLRQLVDEIKTSYEFPEEFSL